MLRSAIGSRQGGGAPRARRATSRTRKTAVTQLAARAAVGAHEARTDRRSADVP